MRAALLGWLRKIPVVRFVLDWLDAYPFVKSLLSVLATVLMLVVVFDASWGEAWLVGIGFYVAFAALDLLKRTDLTWWAQAAIVLLVFLGTLLEQSSRDQSLTDAIGPAVLVTAMFAGWVMFRRGRRPPEAPRYEGPLSSPARIPDNARH